MLTHDFFTWDYLHILDTTSILVIHKNVFNHFFIFTRFKCYKPTFLFLETSIHQAQPFTNCPVQQSEIFGRQSTSQALSGASMVFNMECGIVSGNIGEISETLKRRCVDIYCLQEVRWKGEGAKMTGNF